MRTWVAGMSIVIAGSALATQVVAQIPADGDGNATTLEEVVVTAEKRSEDLQKTAATVEVVQREDIEKRGLTTVEEAIKTVPGVVIRDNAQGGAAIFIRGIGNNEVDATLNNMPAVAINVDGVVNSQQYGVTDSMFDVDRVEVLKGPQGTLYGASAEGGVVNIVLAQPKNDFEVRGRLQVGNYDARQTEAMVNVPLGNQLAVRITASDNKRDGYINGPAYYTYSCPAGTGGAPLPTGACVDGPAGPGTQAVPFTADNHGALDTTNYRIKAKYDPVEWFSITGTYEQTKVIETDDVGITYANLEAGNYYSDSPTTSTQSMKYKVFSANAVVTLGDFGQLTVIPTRRTTDTLPSIGPSQFPPNLTSSTQDTYEARLGSLPGARMIWTFGAYIDRESGNFTTDITTSSAANGPGYELLQLARPFDTWNVFGQLTYPVTNAFRVTVGGRYSHSEPGYSYQLYKSHFVGSALVIDTITPTVTESISQSRFTPKVGVEYDLTAKSMAYAEVSTGYKAGGLSLADTGPAGSTIGSPADVLLFPYKPEVATSFEVGSKNRFLNDRLQVNGDIFYTRWQNMQVQAFDYAPGSDTSCTGSFCDYVQSIYNADTSSQIGFELDTTWLATANDKLGLNLSALHGKYGRLSYVEFGSTVDLTGKTMANSPTVAGVLSYEHRFHITGNLTLTPAVNEQFTTWYYATHEASSGAAGFSSGRVPGYQKTDANLSLSGKKWTLSLYGRNLWNKATAQTVGAAAPGGVGNVTVSAPRVVGVSIVGSY